MILGIRVMLSLITFTSFATAFGQWPWNEQRPSGMSLQGELKAGVLIDLKRGLKAEVELIALNHLSTSWVSLGQISQCRGSQSICTYVDSVVFERSGKPGTTQSIDKNKFESSLPSFIRDAGGVKVSGPDSISLHYQSRKMTPQQIRSALDSSIMGINQNIANVRMTVSKFRLRRNPVVRPVELSIKFPTLDLLEDINEFQVMKKFHGQTILPFTIFEPEVDDGGEQGELIFYASYEMRVLVANRVIEAKEKLLPESFKFEWRKLTRSADLYPGSSLNFVAYVARRRINANSILFFRDIKKPDLVKAGSDVVLEIHKESMMLSAIVKARASGQKGDVIDVIYPSTRKSIKARVIGKNRLVRVNL